MKKILLLVALAMLSLQGLAQAGPSTPHSLAKTLFDYDRAIPVKVEKQKEETRDGLTYTWFKVISVLDSRVPLLLIRNPAKPPKRLFLIQHGNGSNKENGRLVEVGVGLVKAMDYAVILTDAMYHGDRTSPVVGPWGGQNLATQPNNLRDIFLQTVRDHRRVLDAKKELLGGLDLPVDYMGESLGSLMGSVTVSLDRRIGRAVFLVGGANFFLINPLSRTIKGIEDLRQVIDPFYWVPEIQVPVLMLNGKNDMVISPPSSKVMYDMVGSKVKKQIWYDTGHGLDPKAVLKDTLTWLKATPP